MFWMVTEQMYEGDEFQPKFVFTADDTIEARLIKDRWCRYHSLNNKMVRVREATDGERSWLHNEYIDWLRS